MLRIAFFGLPLAALLLAEDGHDVVLAAICRDDAPGLRRARRRFGERLLVRPDASSPSLLERVRRAEPDLVVSWFWTKRLPMALVETARLGGINVHPSLLPRHRGPDPTYWAIALGDAETGVTVHRIAEGYDTGALLAQRALPIDPSWDGWKLARALDRPSLTLLRETASRLARGERFPETPQDEALATSAPFLDDEGRALRFGEPTEVLLRHVRGLAPSPGAWTEIAGTLVTILRAERAPRWPEALEPGEGTVVSGRALVRTGDGAIFLLEGEIVEEDEGGGDEGRRTLLGPRELAALLERGPGERGPGERGPGERGPGAGRRDEERLEDGGEAS